jgi:hypothetical protein
MTMTSDMTGEFRRRVDRVLDPEFTEDLLDVPPGELRSRLRDAREEEDAISYVRRNLHGRIALLTDELLARRGGRGTSHSVDALASALGETGALSRGARQGVALRASVVAGRRGAERVLSETHLANLPDLDEDEIEGLLDRAEGAERELSEVRHRLHEVIDALEDELAGRYKNGLELPLGRLR